MHAPDRFAALVAEEDLERLDTELVRAVSVDDPLLGEVATHLIVAGGKRLRPALTLAAASLGGRPAELSTLLGGVSIELVHLASLYHDDVMDEATRRRNVVSVNARWGNIVAIVAGDFLLARSAEIAASLGTEIAALIAGTLGRLCQGQVAELRAAFRVDRSEADYLAAIADKTAALMSTACRIGGITAGLDASLVDALTAYGEALGMVFQVRDDVLDIVASEEELGKEPGQDLAEGIYTLPVQRALADREIGPILRPLLGRPLDRETMETARGLVAASPGIAEAAFVARGYAAEAIDAAERLGNGALQAGLADLVRSLLADLERSTEALAS
ncbi:MAG TPA: polyprenyl synthetase family protein [Acidimicrobiales bacterium]|nr:polyprenyl synthetase family protein [Acidimicrobiales bacterium]